jgi:hypothetical protein
LGLLDCTLSCLRSQISWEKTRNLTALILNSLPVERMVKGPAAEPRHRADLTSSVLLMRLQSNSVFAQPQTGPAPTVHKTNNSSPRANNSLPGCKSHRAQALTHVHLCGYEDCVGLAVQYTTPYTHTAVALPDFDDVPGAFGVCYALMGVSPTPMIQPSVRQL